jgi:hypothetical protein
LSSPCPPLFCPFPCLFFASPLCPHS